MGLTMVPWILILSATFSSIGSTAFILEPVVTGEYIKVKENTLITCTCEGPLNIARCGIEHKEYSNNVQPANNDEANNFHFYCTYFAHHTEFDVGRESKYFPNDVKSTCESFNGSYTISLELSFENTSYPREWRCVGDVFGLGFVTSQYKAFPIGVTPLRLEQGGHNSSDTQLHCSTAPTVPQLGPRSIDWLTESGTPIINGLTNSVTVVTGESGNITTLTLDVADPCIGEKVFICQVQSPSNGNAIVKSERITYFCPATSTAVPIFTTTTPVTEGDGLVTILIIGAVAVIYGLIKIVDIIAAIYICSRWSQRTDGGSVFKGCAALCPMCPTLLLCIVPGLACYVHSRRTRLKKVGQEKEDAAVLRQISEASATLHIGHAYSDLHPPTPYSRMNTLQFAADTMVPQNGLPYRDENVYDEPWMSFGEPSMQRQVSRQVSRPLPDLPENQLPTAALESNEYYRPGHSTQPRKPNPGGGVPLFNSSTGSRRCHPGAYSRVASANQLPLSAAPRDKAFEFLRGEGGINGMDTSNPTGAVFSTQSAGAPDLGYSTATGSRLGKGSLKYYMTNSSSSPKPPMGPVKHPPNAAKADPSTDAAVACSASVNSTPSSSIITASPSMTPVKAQ